MNVLEKILEEIEKEQNSYEADHAWNYSKGLEYAKEIIHSNMDDCKTFEFDFNRVKSFDCQCGRHYVNTYNGGWIPCSERLPEEDERYKGKKIIDVLITTAKGKVTKVQRQSHNEYWWWARIYGEPKAWKPLPEPYKGTNNNE